MDVVGLDIGGTKCAVVAGGADGHILARRAFDTTNVQETLDLLTQTVEELEPGPNPLFGVSCGGPLDWRRGVVMSPPNLPAWDDVPITRMLEERFGGRAYLMNDANAGALAEWRFGAARGCENVVFLTCGTGMGGGLILSGRLYEGATGMAGEAGHMRLAQDGPVGYGKAGSFEGWCSGGGIARAARAEAERLSLARPFGAASPAGVTARHVVEAAQEGDAVALGVLSTAGRFLGLALSALIDTLNPEIIVLGSLYGRARRFLEPAMRQALVDETLAGPLGACRIEPAGLGEAIGDLAAVSVALYRSGYWET